MAVIAATVWSAGPVSAADLGWSATPANGDYNTGTNWVGATVPGASDTAIFAGSDTTSLLMTAPTDIGRWQFVGPNDFTFNTNNQVVQFLDGGITVVGGSATINVTGNDSELSFQNGSTSGSATINVTAFDSVTYFGTGSDAGTSKITLDTGLLQFLGDGSAANATITANTVGATGASVTFFEQSTAGGAAITLNGFLTTLTFQEESTAANATITANASTVRFIDDSTAGNATITASAGSTQVLFAHNSSAGSSKIELSGFLTQMYFVDNSSAENAQIKAHDGTFVNFNGSSTAGTSHIDSTGRLNFYNDSSAESAEVTLSGGAIATFSDQSKAGSANFTANGGALGGGAVVFQGNSSAENAVVRATGTNAGAQIGDQASGGDARFVINDGAGFQIAGLTTTGTTAGSIEGSGFFRLGDKSLTVGSNNLSTEVSGFIEGVGGSLNKVGTGTLTLSGTNTYSGETAVFGGVLEMNTASHGSHVRVENGAVLAGTGEFGIALVGPGGLEVKDGGTLAPGPASGGIGTLTVNGSIVLQPGSHFRVDVNAAGQGDRLVSQFGTVNLTGAILDVIAANGNYGLSTSYTIIERSSTFPVTGEFASITTNLAFLDPSVNYAGGPLGGDVVLTMTRNFVDFSDVATTPNQAAVAGTLEQFSTNEPLILALLNQTASGSRQAFDALSGELHASIAGLLVDESHFVRDAVLARLVQASCGGSASTSLAALGASGPTTVAGLGGAPMMGLGTADGAAAAPTSGHGLAFWTQGFGSWGDFKGDGNAASADRTLGGFVSGVDGHLGSGWRAGLAVGYTQTDASVDARLSSADIESYHLAAYAGGRLGGLALRAGAAWTWHDIDTTRTIVFPGFFDRAEASYDGDTGQVFGELALPFAAGGVALEPFAGLAYVHVNTGGFTESGGIAALTASESNQDVGYSRLGLRAAATMFLGGMQVVPHASAAWVHAFGDVTPDMALAFASPSVGFTISGVPIARDSALLEAGFDVRIARDATLGVSYQGQVGDGVEDHGFNGRLNWRF